jgi:hypothetical protein
MNSLSLLIVVQFILLIDVNGTIFLSSLKSHAPTILDGPTDNPDDHTTDNPDDHTTDADDPFNYGCDIDSGDCTKHWIITEVSIIGGALSFCILCILLQNCRNCYLRRQRLKNHNRQHGAASANQNNLPEYDSIFATPHSYYELYTMRRTYGLSLNPNELLPPPDFDASYLNNEMSSENEVILNFMELLPPPPSYMDCEQSRDLEAPPEYASITMT